MDRRHAAAAGSRSLRGPVDAGRDAKPPLTRRRRRAHRDHGLRSGRVDAWRAAWRSAATPSPSSTSTSTPSAGSVPDFAGKTVKGVGFDREVLLEAGIEEADGFAAVSSGDNSNILSARVVRETFGVDNVVARIYDPGRAEVYERLGIPTVATVRWTADQVLRRLLPAGSEPQWRDPSGSVAADRGPRRPQLGGPDRRPDRGSHRTPGCRSSSGSAPEWCPSAARSSRTATWSTPRSSMPGSPRSRRSSVDRQAGMNGNHMLAREI